MGSFRRFDMKELIVQIEEEADPRHAFAKVQDRIKEYREAGWPVPDGLKRVERDLMADFLAESQGR